MEDPFSGKDADNVVYLVTPMVLCVVNCRRFVPRAVQCPPRCLRQSLGLFSFPTNTMGSKSCKSIQNLSVPLLSVEPVPALKVDTEREDDARNTSRKLDGDRRRDKIM